MDIGTVETVDEPLKRRKAAVRSFSSSRGSGSGGNDGPGDDGHDRPNFSDEDEVSDAPTIDKSKYISWFLMIAVGMTFAGLLGAYLMIATTKAAEWKPFTLPLQVWISTVIIALSSVTYVIAKRFIDSASLTTARTWLIVTTVLGASFISSQFLVWLDLVNRGFYMAGNPYAGFFYILTAAHLVHVAGGIAALGAILLRIWQPATDEHSLTRYRDLARSVGWYWHFMGFLWVVLFGMLGFWK
ncbi:MAG: heme-copper oxidase subunit III [Pyrinomonadaceae bacterium]